MATVRETRVVSRANAPLVFQLRCPRCDRWIDLTSVQWEGRAPIECDPERRAGRAQRSSCSFRETIDFTQTRAG